MSDFIYCLNSSTIRPAPLSEKIRIANAVGYKAIELWHDDIDLYLLQGGTLEDLRKELDDAGLQDPNLDYEQGARNYAELLDIGIRQFGVRPVMEYLGFAQDLKTIEAALRIIELSGHADATTVVDPFHCYVGGGPIESISKLVPSQIAISHFNDAPAEPEPSTQRDPDRVMPGDGVIDLKLFCDQLRAIGYDKCLSLEIFNRDYWEQDPEEVARVGLEKMRAAAEA
jgi:sugar phosphate isomerase/epimerase